MAPPGRIPLHRGAHRCASLDILCRSNGGLVNRYLAELPRRCHPDRQQERGQEQPFTSCARRHGEASPRVRQACYLTAITTLDRFVRSLSRPSSRREKEVASHILIRGNLNDDEKRCCPRRDNRRINSLFPDRARDRGGFVPNIGASWCLVANHNLTGGIIPNVQVGKAVGITYSPCTIRPDVKGKTGPRIAVTVGIEIGGGVIHGTDRGVDRERLALFLSTHRRGNGDGQQQRCYQGTGPVNQLYPSSGPRLHRPLPFLPALLTQSRHRILAEPCHRGQLRSSLLPVSRLPLQLALRYSQIHKPGRAPP